MSAELNPIALLQEAFEAQKQENLSLQESIAEIRAMMNYEDAGWLLLGAKAAGVVDGLDLEEVQQIADKIAPKVAGSSLPKRAVDLHSGFVWGRGCYIEGTEKPKGPGRTPASRSFFVDTDNQEALFSDSAREELQKERFISGNILAAVNTRTKKVNRIPFKEITGIVQDPDFPEKIIAYQRTWDTHDGTPNSVKKRWYYTKRHSGPRKAYFEDEAKNRVPVDKDITVVDLRANRQVGHVFGIPDGLAGLLWSETYGRVLNYGETVQEGLAKIIFQVTNKTKAGTQSTGVKIANFRGHGGTASMAEGQELTAVSTAGKGYDYSSARPIAAMAAAAWNVSTADLLNDASANGSSYGSAQSLVSGNRNAMLLMQREWADFYKDIFDAAGLGRPHVVFEPFEAPDKYREVQAITLGATTLSDEEYRMAMLDALDIVADPSDIPPSLAARNVQTQTGSSTSSGVQQASPGQGRNNPAGSAGSSDSNDLRSDTISNEALLARMQNESLIERLENILNRLDEAGL